MGIEPRKNQPLKGMARLLAAWHNSRAGFSDIWATEEAFRIEVMAFFASIPLSFLVASDPFHAALLIASIIMVMIVEVINSAIEATIDRIGPDYNEFSRIAKDLGSLAVLLAAVMSAMLWIVSIVSI
ncbi:diacylglycerol kinase [uncultured Marivita sp.]|uniref:diacylglycerol kinase n=1 Tax=uncultured Marivita sp. TaxID=888080 RepID=UPI002639918E|nr:diacylglycerol kinase [uncultured Marivita sp.]